MARFIIPSILMSVLALAEVCAAPTAVVKDLAYPGGTERTLLLVADQPKAAVILFPGGDGVIKLDSAGHIGDPTNFLVRSRAHWVERGYSVLLPDAPLGGSPLMGQRITESYEGAVAALVNYARETSPAPVWLVGTSQGTNAVVGAASRMTHGEIAGIILTATVTEPGKAKDEKETVFNADLAAVNVPVLVVADADDTCTLTPPDDREKLRAAFTGSPLAKAILVSGGKAARSAPCEAESGHGFYGIEVDTIKHMASFIAAH